MTTHNEPVPDPKHLKIEWQCKQLTGKDLRVLLKEVSK